MSQFLKLSSKQKKLYTGALLLSFLAAIVTILLVDAHYKGFGADSFCVIDDYWNCDRVNKSQFAVLFGIPVAIFGLLYYLGFTAVIAAALKGFNFSKFLNPIKIRTLTLLSIIFGVVTTIAMGVYEFTILKDFAIYGFVRNVVFALVFVWIWSLVRKNKDEGVQFHALLTSVAFFGVSFAVYLSDIEFFFLKAVCIYCLTQEIFIILMSILFALNLKHVLKND